MNSTEQHELPMQVLVNNSQATLAVDEPLLAQAARAILLDAGVRRGSLSIAVVDDPQIHQVNLRYLDHDYPTDVLSFALEEQAGRLEGEVVVSADTAAANAAEYGLSAAQELLLYVIHGTLHLVGYRDKNDADRDEMQRAEQTYLSRYANPEAAAAQRRR